MSDDVLCRLSASTLTHLYRHGDASPVEVVEAVLARIARIDPSLNAFATLDADGARAAARASEARWQAQEPRSPLDGVPVGIKDNLAVRGMRSTWGSALYRDHLPAADELPVARLRDAGLVLLGKTNVPEFTLQGYTDNALFGPTHNPWCPGRTPGGSSGGAAAAVAAGMGPLALCTDGGGSIRRPAGHTGLVGFKPSTGRVPRADGFPVILQDFEVAGPITRTVADSAAMMQLLAPPHPIDARSLRFPVPAFDARPVMGSLKILRVRGVGDAPVDPEILASLDEVAGRFERLGHWVETAPDFPLPRAVNEEVFPTVSAAGLAWLLRGFPDWRRRIGASLLPIAESGLRAEAADLVEALAIARTVAARVQAMLRRYDLLLMPTAAAQPWEVTEPFPKTIAGRTVGPRGHAIFTAFANAADLPAIALPGPPAADGMPIGFQLVGAFGDDERVCAVAAQYEAAHPWFERWPSGVDAPRAAAVPAG